VLNVNLGVQHRISPKTAFQAGFFTDFSGQPQDLVIQDQLHPHINRYGVTLGLSFKGTSSTTMVGIIATAGFGRSFGLVQDPTGAYNDGTAPARSEAIYFTLGGSTRLGDPPEKPALAPTPQAAPAETVPVLAPPTPVPVVEPASHTEAQEKSASDAHSKRKPRAKNKTPRPAEGGQP
jgi:hypothetical protein